jgi:hypothetical protein
MAFDIEGARREGYTEEEIAQYLESKSNKNIPKFDVSAKQFDVQGALNEGYTEEEIANYLKQKNIGQVKQNDIFKDVPGQELKTETAWDRMRSNLINAYRKVGRPGLEMLGMAGGALAGTGWMTPIGAGLGAAGMSKALDTIEEATGLKKPSTFKEAATSSIYDFGAGAAGEMLGPLASKAMGLVGKGVNRVGKELLGLTTGAGKGAVEGALRGGQAFTDAMKGNISGEEVSQNARNALEVIVAKRGEQYRNALAAIAKDKELPESEVQYIGNKLLNIINKNRFDIEMITDPKTGTISFDFAKSPVIEQQPLVKRALEDVANWKDNTILGIDELKKRLGVYARQVKPRSPASAIINSLESSVNNVLVKNVPNYSKMTRQYAEATRLIKDIESGLMLRKEGMSGRITADNTLRRLQSALRENFEMRKDLLDALSNESGQDIYGQVAGYAMNQSLPHGLIGRLSAGGVGLLSYLNPTMLPVILAASPRVVGSFLNVYGKALRASKPVTDTISQTAKKLANPASYLAIKDQGGLE